MLLFLQPQLRTSGALARPVGCYQLVGSLRCCVKHKEMPLKLILRRIRKLAPLSLHCTFGLPFCPLSWHSKVR